MHSRTRLVNGRDTGVASKRAFEALVNYSLYHRLPEEAPLTIRGTSSGWRVFSRTQTGMALRMMLGSYGGDPMQSALLRKNPGNYPVVSCAGASSTCKNIQVSGFHDVRAGDKGDEKRCLHRPRKNA